MTLPNEEIASRVTEEICEFQQKRMDELFEIDCATARMIIYEKILSAIRQAQEKMTVNMKIRTEKIIDVSEWDKLVTKVYNRPYSFQQQNGGVGRGLFTFVVPQETEGFSNDTILETPNCDEMGVSFAAWLKRDPNTPLIGQQYNFELELWWERNFYPDFQMVANDLYTKGLLKAGNYAINIDW